MQDAMLSCHIPQYRQQSQAAPIVTDFCLWSLYATKTASNTVLQPVKNEYGLHKSRTNNTHITGSLLPRHKLTVSW